MHNYFALGQVLLPASPNGVSSTPDIFQEIMADLFGEFDFVICYIDDLLIITKGDEDVHMDHITQVFAVLMEYGFQVNPLKCTFFARSAEYLRFLISRRGLSPLPDRIQAIMTISPPKTPA